MPTTPDPIDLDTALAGIANLDLDCWHDNATAFTCAEADAIADLLAYLHGPDTAAAFIASHAEGDDEGDEHGART